MSPHLGCDAQLTLNSGHFIEFYRHFIEFFGATAPRGHRRGCCGKQRVVRVCGRGRRRRLRHPKALLANLGRIFILYGKITDSPAMEIGPLRANSLRYQLPKGSAALGGEIRADVACLPT